MGLYRAYSVGRVWHVYGGFLGLVEFAEFGAERLQIPTFFLPGGGGGGGKPYV